MNGFLSNISEYIFCSRKRDRKKSIEDSYIKNNCK